jgi:LmbE family N-acetylglucosaminyl deacetylase
VRAPRRSVALWVVLAVWALARPSHGADEVAELPVHEKERLLVVAPHPDDETLATGGLIQRVLANHGSVRLVTLTAGDGYREALVRQSGEAHPRPEEFKAYGERRIDELQDAAKVLGKKVQLSVLGFPDGGLDGVLRGHWARTHPERSATTGETSPPYAEAADRRLKYDGADLRAELLRIVRETDPTIVAFPDPDDRHPDHATTGLFALLALNDWVDETQKKPSELPRLLGNIVHWRAWPPAPPAGLSSAEAHALGLELPPDLPHPQRPVVKLTLTDAEVERKAAALQHHRSQQEAMGSFLALFERREEPFRVFGPSDLDAVEALVEEVREGAAGAAKDRAPR